MWIPLAVYAILGGPASAPCIELLTPNPALAPTTLDIHVHGAAALQIAVTIDGQPVAEGAGTSLQVPLDPGPPGGIVQVEIVAALADGRLLELAQGLVVVYAAEVEAIELVAVPVVVLDDAHRPVIGLKLADFNLTVDGRPTPIASFADGGMPFAVAILLDCSSSMLGGRFDVARRAAGELVRRLGPRDRALIIGFDHRPRLYAPLTSDHSTLEAALDAMRTGGGTSLYDALALAIDGLQAARGRSAIVLLSDGEDALSTTRPADVERRARGANVVLYTFAVEDLDAPPGRTTPERKTSRRLAALADDLGGRAFAPADGDELLAGYQTVIDEMRAQYTLGFVPTGRRDRRRHPIRVRVKADHRELRARREWLAEP